MSGQRVVAVLGMGRMGAAMASTIARSGLTVTVWNRSADKARAVAERVGCEVAGTAAEACAGADYVITSLADDAAVKAVYLSDDGICSGVGPGQVVIDTSTIDPATVIEVGEAVDATGARFLDCPVSGSVSVVEAGNLTIMAGGTAADVEAVRPALDPIAGRIIHTGARGTGAAMKLAINSLVHAMNVALAEALVLAERAGIDRKVAYEVFASGATGAPFVHYKRQAFEDPENTPVAFSLDLVQKDLELITGLGERTGTPQPAAKTALDLVREANEEGYGERDMSAVAEFLRGRAG
jgi:3-hydroxyisobutyrate dehydrogenase-like beta-hydroxyacid dehydrogenase